MFTRRFKISKVSKNSKISNDGSVASTSEKSWRNVGEEAAIAPALSGDLQRMSQLMKDVQQWIKYLPNWRWLKRKFYENNKSKLSDVASNPWLPWVLCEALLLLLVRIYFGLLLRIVQTNTNVYTTHISVRIQLRSPGSRTISILMKRNGGIRQWSSRTRFQSFGLRERFKYAFTQKAKD